MRKPKRALAVFAAGCVAWLSVVTLGLTVVAKHDAAAGEAAESPSAWPARSRLTRDLTRPTLVMLVHPECVCTNASITELERLMARQSSRLAARVLMVAPRGLPNDPLASAKWSRLSHIPGVTLTLDADGNEARIFGAHTSGQVVMYDAHGALVFQGGITASRGHEGDNDGVDAIEGLLTGDENRSTSPVYGCALAQEGAR